MESINYVKYFEDVMNKYPPEMQERIKKGMGCGVDYFPGWHTLIVVLDEYLALRNPDYKIDQIKEKFGSLRFYVSGVEEGYEMIDMVEMFTEAICEKCGAPGKRRDDNGWWKTLCDNCTSAKNDQGIQDS